MPEYLAPGVYVEEVSFRSKSIEGVSTTTTAFVGPTRYGPLYDTPDVLTSLGDFEAVYGDGQPLDINGTAVDNYMWHAARAFFNEGGRRLYVKRIYRGQGITDPHIDQGGRATKALGPITVSARHPGEYGNFHVRFTLQLGQNVLAMQKNESNEDVPKLRGVSEGDVVLVTHHGSPSTQHYASAESYIDTTTGARTWRFPEVTSPPTSPATVADLATMTAADSVQVITVTVSVALDEPGAVPRVWAGLPLDPAHTLGGSPDSMTAIFDRERAASRTTPIVIEHGTDTDGIAILETFFAEAPAMSPGPALQDALLDPDSDIPHRSIDIVLEQGTDGDAVIDADYEGVSRPDDSKTGLLALEDIDDISIVAAPGSSRGYNDNPDQAHAIINGLITHAQKMRYRIAVIDAGDKMTIAQVRVMRAQFDSSWAAFYYPWIEILDPITNQEKLMPPSGFVAGIYARNDVLRAVYKAPANEVVNLAIGFERLLNKGQQEVLNPEGVNCFRFFPGRGYRLWGARTMSSDSEWKYVNLRRYFAFLEHSIDRGTQWAVFEPNGEALWANVRRTIDDFLFDQWQNGALLGDKPEKSYFVRCDRSTMTQNDLDNGRLVCLIGVAPLRPAEFVIFRIGQWTADAKR
jgi:phage tail sheath protein FI